MFRPGITRVRLVVFAALLAFGGGSLRVGVSSSAPPDAAGHPRTFDATTLVTSLPSHLSPTLEPGLRLVAIVASDIDNDGDLDLVANDGSLDLLVWINDGTGHLTRRYARHPGGWSEDAQTANSSTRHSTVSAIASPSASLGAGPWSSLQLTDDGRLRVTYEPPDLDSLFARSQHPRAPPLSRPSI